LKLKHIKTAILLTGATIISCLSCNGVYAYAQESSMEDLIKTNQELLQQNEELKSENKRLHNMISQYSIALRGINLEVEETKATTNVLEESISDMEEIIENENYMRDIGTFTLTYYCKEPGCRICGGGGKTASGTQVTPGRSVAVDPKVIPLGTKIYIDGLGYRIAEDTGGAVKGNKIDVNVNTHAEALQLGRTHNVKVWIVE